MSQGIEAAASGIQALSRRATRRRGWAWLESYATVGLGVMILAGMLLYVWLHTHVLREAYATERLREMRAALVQENKSLRLEIGQIRSLRRVEEIARTRLGMVTPKAGQVQLIPDDRIQ
ncbi:MAG: cell division protein FtsL [candidate division NC10 bacterium]|nr:cell division protein FtsL [candidate division NC10 bacterium]